MHFITMVVLKEESLSNLRKVVCVFMLQGTAHIVPNLGTEEHRNVLHQVTQQSFHYSNKYNSKYFNLLNLHDN